MKIGNKILFALMFTLTGCTDADRAKFAAYGDAGTIVCYSGGKEIYNAKSTGKISSETQSDGWFLKEEGSGDLIRVSGDCVVRN